METSMINKFTILNDDAMIGLGKIPSKFVQCIVTSPPYFNLRDYQTGTWVGGSDTCDHSYKKARNDGGRQNIGSFHGSLADDSDKGAIMYRNVCAKCGATRQDSQIGLEDSVEEYVSRIVGVFQEARRVLSDNGTVFLNIGDSWANSRRGGATSLAKSGYRNKDLLMVPFHLAIALQKDGWCVRQAIIWHAPNKMPESVTDRCTNAHEYVFLLSKSTSYYFDYESIMEPAAYDGRKKTTLNPGGKYVDGSQFPGSSNTINRNGGERWNFVDGVAMRRSRSVWSIPTRGFRGAHYAPMPLALAEKCVIAGCPVGGIVLDPFCGSGTTIIASLKNERNAIGIELGGQYVEIAKKRINNEIGFADDLDLTSEISDGIM
jgi:site-specific DNA-methyltransferase (cytosine-N4-specific)